MRELHLYTKYPLSFSLFLKVNKATGFFKGLYSGSELDAKSIQVGPVVCRL